MKTIPRTSIEARCKLMKFVRDNFRDLRLLVEELQTKGDDERVLSGVAFCLGQLSAECLNLGEDQLVAALMPCECEWLKQINTRWAAYIHRDREACGLFADIVPPTKEKLLEEYPASEFAMWSRIAEQVVLSGQDQIHVMENEARPC